MSTSRFPKYPLIPINIVSPGSIMLHTHASMAADPVPLTGMVKSLVVWKVYRSYTYNHMNIQIGCGFLLLLQCEYTSFLQTHTLLRPRTCAHINTQTFTQNTHNITHTPAT